MDAEKTGDRSASGDGGETGPLSESDQVRKDISYSPSSEDETRQKQAEPLPDGIDDDIDTSLVRAVPGTGGPDDTGDVEVDPADLNMPGRP